MGDTTRIPSLHLSGDWETILEGKARDQLEREILPEYLRTQRWFGGKGRRITSLRFVDWGKVPAPNSCCLLVLLEVNFTDGQSDHYFFPLGVTPADSAARFASSAAPLRIAWLKGPEGEALLHDALADEDICQFLLTAIGSCSEFVMRHGRVQAFPTASFAEQRGDPKQSLPVKRGPATSSNSLMFYGQRLLLKLFRRLESGINPDFEIGRFLTESKRFERLPRVAGAIEYHRSGSEPITLAILQSFIVNQGDGWHHAVDELHRYYKRVCQADSIIGDAPSLLELAELAPPVAIAEAIGAYLDAASTLGRRTAEMHQALADGANNPDFAPEPFTPEDTRALRGRIESQARSTFAVLRDNVERLPKDVALTAQQLLQSERPASAGWWEPYQPADAGRSPSCKIRCHGDYHLGQTVRVEDDYAILDFEGEPTRTVAERRAKQSPLKDVAGMIRSYHYAAYAGLFEATRNDGEALPRLMLWAEQWFQWISAAFLRAYLARARGETFLPADPAQVGVLLDAFMLDKAFYELNYELNNRPDWVRIPLRGIVSLLGERPA